MNSSNNNENKHQISTNSTTTTNVPANAELEARQAAQFGNIETLRRLD
jgi:hypothetical protein